MSRVTMEIFDASGARIWSHEDRSVPAGEHAVVWNGASSDGVDLPAGTYFLRSMFVAENAGRRNHSFTPEQITTTMEGSYRSTTSTQSYDSVR
jgi:flagellar hook assembly protein FlgD